MSWFEFEGRWVEGEHSQSYAVPLGDILELSKQETVRGATTLLTLRSGKLYMLEEPFADVLNRMRKGA